MADREKFKGQKAILIHRVSSKTQQEEGYSLEAQEKFGLEYAKRNGLEVVKIFSYAESAKNAEGREFNRACDYAIERHIPHLVFEKTDRLTRNVYSQARTYKLTQDHDKTFHFYKQNLIFDKDSRSDEKFRFNIEASMAQKYIDNLSEEVKKGQKIKVEQLGWYPGAAPLGYVNSISPQGLKIITKENELASVIREAFILAADPKQSLKSIIQQLKGSGLAYRKSGKPFSAGTLQKILESPFYIGMFRWAGKTYMGKHEPIVTRELFEQVQEARKSKFKKSRPSWRRELAFGGLLLCEQCGCAVVGETKKKKSGKVYVYYHCTNGKKIHSKIPKYIREEEISDTLSDAVGLVRIDQNTVDYVKQILIDHSTREKEVNKVNIQAVQRKYIQLQSYIDKSYEDKLTGRITESFWLVRNEKWRAEQEELNRHLVQYERADDSYMDMGIKILELAKNAQQLYRERSPQEQRQLIDVLLSNLRLDGTTIRYDYKKPFDLIVNASKDSKWLRRRDSNSRPSG